MPTAPKKNRLKRTYTATFVHDLTNITTALSLYFDELEASLHSIQDDSREHLCTINQLIIKLHKHLEQDSL